MTLVVACLSYPTSVLLRLDTLRPRVSLPYPIVCDRATVPHLFAAAERALARRAGDDRCGEGGALGYRTPPLSLYSHDDLSRAHALS